MEEDILRVVVKRVMFNPSCGEKGSEKVRVFDIGNRDDLIGLRKYMTENEPEYGGIWVDSVEVIRSQV